MSFLALKLRQQRFPGRSFALRREQLTSQVGSFFQRREERNVPFGAMQKVGQRGRVACGEIAGIIVAEHADATGDSRSDDGNPSDERFRNDRRPSFRQRSHCQQPCSRKDGQRYFVRKVAEPAIAVVGHHFPRCPVGHVRRESAADVRNENPRIGTQEANGLGRAERIFHGAKMAGDADFKIVFKWK